MAALAGLTGLTWLDLEGTSITDVSPLAGLPHLGMLELSGFLADIEL